MSTDPEVRSRAQRRNFTAEQKAKILAAYDAATSSLERAEIARQSGIYSSLISNWRKQLREAEKPAPKRGRPANPEAVEVRRLREENARLQRRLEKSERTVKALGKAHALLQMIAGESATDEPTSKES
jgi:transposase-like protein